ncbi:MAG: hypothetical protein ACJAT2_003594 [Bacteriovoracaceae bacterium]|jgi:hypothetical protein
MNIIVRRVLESLNLVKPFRIQTFTYYIPAPPPRKTGYREKQFDKVFYNFINSGYRILDTKTQSNTGENGSGMWVIFTVQATNKKAEALDFDTFLNEQVLDEIEVSEDETVEGLYQINN